MIENQPGRAETIRQAAEEIRKMNLFNNTFMSTAMRDFKTADPDDMSQGALSKRVRYLKSDWRGGLELDEVAERIYSLGEASGREEGRAEGREEGRAEGRKEGRAEGRAEEKRKFALRLHRKGNDVHSIADDVDASIELVCEWLGIAPVTA